MKNYLYLSYLLLLALLLVQCRRSEVPTTLNPALEKYLEAYTAGAISRKSDIRIRLRNPVITDEQVGTEARSSLLRTQPSVSGRLYWEDTRTLVLVPEALLRPGTSYTYTIDLKALIPDIEDAAATYTGGFIVRQQHMDFRLENLATPDPGNYGEVTLHGMILTSDWADSSDIRTAVTIRQGGKATDFAVRSEPGGMVHHLTAEKLARTNAESMIEVSWNGQAIGSESKGSTQVRLAPLSEFGVREVRIVAADEPHILVSVTDPLEQGQDLNGLIRIESYDQALRYMIEGNQVRVYPGNIAAGKYRVIVNNGLVNSKGDRLKGYTSWDVEFAAARPAVRFAGKGNIVTTSDQGTILPIEATGLRAVEVEVFKVFAGNTLQYLQTDYDNSYELRKVGRLIHRQRIDLPFATTGDSGQWRRYGIDLSKMIDNDLNAFYSVRIGFKPAYTFWDCAAQIQGEDWPQNDRGWSDAGDSLYSFYDDNYSGFVGGYEDYDWNRREDPCYPEYYNQEHFISRMIFLCDAGLIAKQGSANNWQLIATDLQTAAPVQGMQVTLYDYQQQPLAQGSTDQNGWLQLHTTRSPFVAVGERNGRKTFLKLAENASLQLSRFDVEGATPQKGLKAFIYGDRGIWRPGDSIYLNMILEDALAQDLQGLPVQAELIDPRGQLFSRIPVRATSGPLYTWSLHTPQDAETGRWVFQVKVGAATFTKALLIETIQPNRLKIRFDPGVRETSASSPRLSATLDAEWLHGAPASGLRSTVEIKLSRVATQFATYKDFRFDDPARTLTSEPNLVFDGQLDERGHAPVPISLPPTHTAAGKMQIEFKTRVFERGGAFSTDQFSIPHSPFSAYTGVRIPRDRYGQNRLELNQTQKVDLVAVDKSGTPLAGHKLSIGLYQVEWRWWWDDYGDDVSGFQSASHVNAGQTYEVVTDSKGMASVEMKIEHWGRYLLRACDESSGHCTGDYFYAGYPWYDDESLDFDESAVLALGTSKKTYTVGEDIQLNIPGIAGARILVSLENGSGVLFTRWYDAKADENIIRIPATADMMPNVYANVSLIQPNNARNPDLPLRQYGVVPVMISNPAAHLQPRIEMPAALRAEQAFTVTVSEHQGKPMHYTLAVVDEGLLSITRFATPDPLAFFFAREALGVRTWDLFDKVLGRFTGDAGRLLRIGGDGAAGKVQDTPKASRFKPVVLFAGPFSLDKGKKGKHTLKMPAYIGAVRVMVVAAGDKQYGHAEQTVKVQQPLMVLATLPRVLGPGETADLPVNLFAMGKKVGSATVTVEEKTGLVSFPEGNKLNVDFGGKEEQIAYLPIRVKNAVGKAVFRIQAEGGGEKSTQEIEIDIRNANPPISKTIFREITGSGAAQSLTWTLPGVAGTNSATLELSSVPPVNFGDRLSYLLNYPYGCLEQTLSAAFPQLFLADIVQLSEDQQRRQQNNIRAAISRLRSFAHPKGGLAYWPGSDHPDHWVTSYATHFLVLAKRKGYAVPENMLDQQLKFMATTARTWSSRQFNEGFYREQSDLDQAYRLYVLSLAGKAEVGAMNRFRETGLQGRTSGWLLAAAFARMGREDAAKKMIRNISAKTESYQGAGQSYGSQLRDQAIRLDAALILREQETAAGLAREIADALNKESWYSTQTTAYALYSISLFYEQEGKGGELKFAYRIANGKLTEASSARPVFLLALSEADLAAGKLELTNRSGRTLFARLSMTGQPAAGAETAAQRGLDIKVSYKDTKGNTIDPASLKQGTDFVAEVKVFNPATANRQLERLALTQVFPSGWEIVNSRLDNMDRNGQSVKFDFQDFRDDRVYSHFSLRPGEQRIVRIHLTAAYAGRFYLPAQLCEAMYDPGISAHNAGSWVTVTRTVPAL